jgi:PAS domain-containing protein
MKSKGTIEVSEMNIIRPMAANGDGTVRQDPKDLQLLVHSIPSLIHTANPDGYLDFFNQTWLRYVGRSLEDLQGWKWTAFIHPEDVEGIVEKWRASLEQGQTEGPGKGSVAVRLRMRRLQSAENSETQGAVCLSGEFTPQAGCKTAATTRNIPHPHTQSDSDSSETEEIRSQTGFFSKFLEHFHI